MKPVVKILTIALASTALVGVILLGRYLYIEINRLKVGEPISFIVSEESEQAPDIVDSNINTEADSETVLNKVLCESGGGHWNDCGSICRNEPPGVLCNEVCVTYCECSANMGYTCPKGYYCTDYVPHYSDPNAIGICVKSKESFSLPEFKSSDNLTSFVLASSTELSNPFIFYGTTTAFENVINWRLIDNNGNKISDGYAMVNSPDMGIPGDFKATAFFDHIPTVSSGRLEVFEMSPKDGSDTHKAIASVTFTNETQKVTVYLGNSKQAPVGQECEVVFPVERMVVAGDPVLISLHELLKGPSPLEIKNDYYTSLPEYLPLPKLIKQTNGLRVDFSNLLEYQVSGSCRVSAIRKQIQETVKQASGIQNITISIDDRTEDILQP